MNITNSLARSTLAIAMTLFSVVPVLAVRHQVGDFVYDCNYISGQLSATLLYYFGQQTEVSIPESVDYEGKTYTLFYIGDEFSRPFLDNAYVEVVHLPKQAVSIGNEAFSNCQHLQSITFGLNLERIGDYAFYHCPRLNQVRMYYALTDIGNYAFAECESLTAITLGRGVTRLGDGVFDKSPLQSLTVSGRTLATWSGSLSYEPTFYNSCSLKVPIGMLAAYQASDTWSQFENIIEIAEAGDINFDGSTDITDVNMLINVILGRITIDIETGDIDSNGQIDIADVNLLINMMIGKVN